MADSVLTVDILREAVRNLPPPRPVPQRVIVSEHLTETIVRELGWFERFRVWLEDITDSANLHYPWPRVRRTEVRPRKDLIIMGDTIFCHPIMLDHIRRAGMGVLRG